MIKFGQIDSLIYKLEDLMWAMKMLICEIASILTLIVW